jgi:hypothetical protein
MSELGLGCVKTQAPVACVEYLGGIAYRESQILLRLDAARENSIFHTSLIFEFSHRCAGRPARSRWCKSTTMKV